MIQLSDLSDIFSLFSQGMAIGVILGGLPFIVGYAIQGILNVMANHR